MLKIHLNTNEIKIHRNIKNSNGSVQSLIVRDNIQFIIQAADHTASHQLLYTDAVQARLLQHSVPFAVQCLCIHAFSVHVHGYSYIQSVYTCMNIRTYIQCRHAWLLTLTTSVDMHAC